MLFIKRTQHDGGLLYIVRILVREKHWAVFKHFRGFPVKLMLFPQDIEITIIFYEKMKTKLNRPLHVSIIERGKQNNRSVRKCYFLVY